MRLTHVLYAKLRLAISAVKRNFSVIDEFLVAASVFTPSPLGRCLREMTALSLTRLCSANRFDQKNTKSRTALVQFGFFLALFTLLFTGQAKPEQITVASAANFVETLRALEKPFSRKTGHTLSIVAGSSGALASQIINAAPFDVFVSADTARIDQLRARGLIEPGTKVIYALGRLSLWSADETRLKSKHLAKILKGKKYRHLAIANPALAPYGKAGLETLRSLGLYHEISDRLIQGQNISQTFTLAASGAAALALVAHSQVMSKKLKTRGSYIIVPANLHQPIRQAAGVVKSTPHGQAARQFINFLKSPYAKDLIKSFGYNVTDNP